MSDFVARVAARAVGAAPAAQPCVPAVFEPPAAASTLDVAEHEIAAAAPRARAPREAPAGPDPAPAPPRHTAQRGAETAPRAGVSQSAPGRSSESDVSILRISRSDPAVENVVPAAASDVSGEAGTRSAPRADPAPAPVRVVVATPAAAAVPTTVPAALPAGHDFASTAARPPDVRVHIGRLEVRANLEQKPPERPRRDAPRRNELALGDYLRGKRDAP